MKLSYPYDAEDNEIKDNELYERFHTIYLNALSAPADRAPSQEKIFADHYFYNLTEDEIEFYEKKFVIAKSYEITTEDNLLQEIFIFRSPEKVAEPIDVNVKDLLHFLEIRDGVLVLIAPIGWGKTVLIKYVWFYLINKSEWLQRHVFPIYVAVDNYISFFQEYTTTREILQDFNTHLVKDRLIDITRHHTRIDNEEFWTYLKSNTDGFNFLEEIEENLRILYKKKTQANKTKLESAIKQERMKAMQKEDFHLYAIKYIVEKKNKKVLLILDNVDPLSIQVNQIILDEAIRLSQRFGFKVLVSMRKNTYFALAANPASLMRAHPPRRVFLEPRNVKDYLLRRFNRIYEELDSRGKRQKESFKIKYEGEKTLSFDDARNVVRSMINVLLTDESAKILDNVSYHNLRKLNQFLIKFFQTGYLDIDKLLLRITQDQSAVDSPHENPLWILLAAIITGNRTTHFPDWQTQEYETHILNVYCNGEEDYNRYLIRIHILNYLSLEKNATASARNILSIYKILDQDAPDSLDDQIKQAIIRFLKCDLVDSPNYYDVSRKYEIEDLNELSITDTGKFYLRTFRNYYEYLVYMKDNVDLRENPFGIRDCITVRRLEDRYLEVLKFLQLIWEEEVDFFRRLNSNFSIYMSNFACPDSKSPSVIYQTVQSMIKFGTEKQLRQESIEQYKELLSHIVNFKPEKLHV